MAIQTVLDGEGITPALTGVVVGGLLIVYATWWIYYERPQDHLLESAGTAFAWSYLHLPIFGAVAAVGAGLVVAIEQAGGHPEIGTVLPGLAVAIPVAIFLMSLWSIYLGLRTTWVHRAVYPVGAVLAVVAAFTPAPVLLVGFVLAGIAAFKVWLAAREFAG
jgi:low temperature requirement protein LtrA